MPSSPCGEYEDLLKDVTERGVTTHEDEAVRNACLIGYIEKFQAIPIWTDEDQTRTTTTE